MRTLIALAALVILGSGAFAAPILTLDPPDLTGLPGQTVGWGFTVEPGDASGEWITFTGSFLLSESNPSIGLYADILGSLGGPQDFVLPPDYGPWSIAYNFDQFVGLGAYFIEPQVVPGATNSGSIRILYERWSANPNECDDCYLGSGELDTAFSVTVTDELPAAVPEPSTTLMLAAGVLILGALRRTPKPVSR